MILRSMRQLTRLKLLKEKIFKHVIGSDPEHTMWYLAKRCMFAYWYYMETQRKQAGSSPCWITCVLARAFTEHSPVTRLMRIVHFSMPFIDQARGLFEAIVAAVGVEFSQGSCLWSRDNPTTETAAVAIVAELGERLQRRSKVLKRRSLEAAHWAVRSCDIQLAYRSLLILRVLDSDVMPSFAQLLVRAVMYHLSRAGRRRLPRGFTLHQRVLQGA